MGSSGNAPQPEAPSLTAAGPLPTEVRAELKGLVFKNLLGPTGVRWL